MPWSVWPTVAFYKNWVYDSKHVSALHTNVINIQQCTLMDQKKSQHFPCIIVHGGAWSIPNPFLEKYYAGIQQAAKAGYGILKNVSIQFCDNITCLYSDLPALST